MISNKTSYEKKGICGVCSAGCWIIAEYDKEGKIINVRPDETSEMGILCKLGEHGPEIIYSKNRIRSPLKRKGPKGTYDFEEITWDEAYNIIIDKLQSIKKEYGPEATAIYTGVGTFELALCDVFQPKDIMVSSASSVLFPFGSPNTMGVGALCYVSYGMIAPHVTTGKILNDMYNDIENSELIVVWGTNPATDLPPIDMKRILKARKNGADVVVIDPRKTKTVDIADAQWVPIRPGTDGALALGLCNVIIEEELYDDNFVKDWTIGFDDFSRYVQHYRPEVVQTITGIPKDTVVGLARKLSDAKGASQLMYTGLEYSNSGVQAIRASLILWALAGQLDVPGGRCFKMLGNSFPINRDGLIKNPDVGPRLGKDKFPAYIHYRDEAHAIALPESVLKGIPYKIRSLIIQGASITTSWPNPDIWRKTLGELDFLVCIDRQMTADAAFADIVLPATTYFENESYMVYGSLFKIRERFIEPLGEARNDFFIMAELADRLGYGHLYPQNEKELFQYVLKNSGFIYDDVVAADGMVSVKAYIMQYKKWEKGLLRKDGKVGFDTPSGKLEIASSILEEFGYDALPEYTEPKEGPVTRPDLLQKFPLIFNSGARVRTSFHTQHHGIKSLNKNRPEPTVTLNDKDAEKRGIKSGDLVRIETQRGAVAMRALVTDRIMEGAIDANHACGSPVGPPAWQNTNVNVLTDLNQYDPISGFPVYKCLLCEVTKLQDAGTFTALSFGEISEEEINLDTSDENNREVYLDNNATTSMSQAVKEAITNALNIYGNPSSIHGAGKESRRVIDYSRRIIADALGSTARRITFTGSGSEANNLAIKGVAIANRKKRNHIITSEIEHPAVLETCRWLENYGFTVTYLPVDSFGLIIPENLEKAITDKTCLVSIMTANNETGTIQPIKRLAAIAHNKNVLFHSDGVQAFGKIPVDVVDLGVDLYTVSAHKVHGPKGIGALYIKKDVNVEALINGGGHEHGMRAGTENIWGIVGFGKAVELIEQSLLKMNDIANLRNLLEEKISEIIPDYRLNGHRELRLPNTLNITLPGFRGESIVLAMDKYGIFFSSGSACKSGTPGPSHALLTMGLSEEEAHCALRISLSAETTEDDIEFTAKKLKETIENSKSMVHFVPCR